MDGQLVTPQPPDELTAETRAFWRDLGRALVKDSIKSSDELAKQLIAVAGILEGLYFHAIAFGDLRDAAKYPPSALVVQWWVYLLPIGFLLFSLVFALAVFFPSAYNLNVQSFEAAKIVFERIARRKLWLVRLASFFLIAGVGAVMYAAYLYLITR